MFLLYDPQYFAFLLHEPQFIVLFQLTLVAISFIIFYLGIVRSGNIVHIVPPEISETNLNNQIKSANSQLIICSENH